MWPFTKRAQRLSADWAPHHPHELCFHSLAFFARWGALCSHHWVNPGHDLPWLPSSTAPPACCLLTWEAPPSLSWFLGSSLLPTLQITILRSFSLRPCDSPPTAPAQLVGLPVCSLEPYYWAPHGLLTFPVLFPLSDWKLHVENSPAQRPILIPCFCFAHNDSQ